MKEIAIEKIIRKLIDATNAFDVDAALALFATDAVIEDISVGEKFRDTTGVRKYIETFFVGYHTVTRLESLDRSGSLHAKAQLDFTGDFGHETGGLDIRLNTEELIIRIHAYLD